MKNVFNNKNLSADSTETVTATGVNRRTLIIVVLAVACLVTSVLVATMSKQGPSTAVASTEVTVDPTFGGSFTLPQSESIVAEAEEIEVASTSGDVPAWASPLDAQYAVASMGESTDPVTRYAEAVRSGGGLYFKADAEEVSSSAPQTQTSPAYSMTSDRTLLEGTLIPAMLEMPINSDRPGPVTARVLHDVKDSQSLKNILIPSQTKILGTIQIAGESQVQINWHRLIFPDGRTLNSDNLPSLDGGGSGVVGSVNRHRFANFGRGFMTAMIGATAALGGAQLSQNGGIVGGALALSLGQSAGSTMNQFTRPPTIKVPVGHRFDIWVEADLLF